MSVTEVYFVDGVLDVAGCRAYLRRMADPQDVKMAEHVNIDTLTPYPSNPRQGDVGLIADSLTRLGQYRPIVVNRRETADTYMTVLAGNHTMEAARQLGWANIAVTWVDVDDETAARIVLVDNRSNDVASYNELVLSELLTELAQTDEGLTATGYDGDDLDLLLADLNRAALKEPDDPDAVGIKVPAKPKTKVGDVIQLGPHRLVCGDASDPAVWGQLVDGYAPINVVFTSPPYADRRPYDETSGFRPIPPNEYVTWFTPISERIEANLADDGSFFLNIKPGVTKDKLDTETYVLELVLAHVRWGWHYATEFCWERPGIPGHVKKRFKNEFEPIYQFTRGPWKMRPDNVRYFSDDVPIRVDDPDGATDVTSGPPGTGLDKVQGLGVDVLPRYRYGPGFAYPGNRLKSFIGTHEALGHAAAFPVGLPQFFFEAYTDPGDVTCDPMMGSGSALIAAQESDRIGLGIELSPAYCDVTVKRWEDRTGEKATR